MPTLTPAATWDGHATATGSLDATASGLWVGSNSTIQDAQAGILIENVQIPRGATVNSFVLTLQRISTNGSSAILIFDIGAHKVVSSTVPANPAELRGRTMTTTRLSVTYPQNLAPGVATHDIAAAIQEIVNQAGWVSGGNILILMRPTGGSVEQPGYSGRRAIFSSLESTTPPSMSITYSLPTVTGQMTLAETATDRLSGTVNAEAPEPSPPVVAQGSFAETVLEGFSAKAVRGDLGKNFPFTFYTELPDTHHFVTEAGAVYGFTARVPTLLGAIRSGMSGATDDAWYPTSGLLTREPAPLEFEAALLDRLEPKLERDRLAAALKEARALYLPDGRVFDLWHAQVADILRDDALLVSCAPRSAEPRHVLLSGSIGAAFETYGSTEQVPIYAVDPAGGIRSPILSKTVSHGSLCFGVRSAERGVEGYASVGRPVEADGTSDPSSITASYREKHLRLSLYGIETRVREEFLAFYGATLVCYLFWRPCYAHLVTVSSLGVFHHDLPIGVATELSERVITAGVRADGVGFGGFIAPGSVSLDAPFFSLAVPTEIEAESAARKLYAELTRTGVSYEAMPPAYAVTLSRADTKALELAPGESLTFDLAATRAGYTGPLEFALTADTLGAAYAVLSTVGDTTTYRVTLTAPAATPEAAYTFRATVKAQGADNEGSLLRDVRDAFDAVVQVAAGPAIAPNATALWYANDPDQKRDAQMLIDSSGNGNTLFWGGYARPNREFTALLATGVYGAFVRSGVLANAAQAQRMGSNGAFSFIFGEVGKSKDGTMVQIAADTSENGVHLLRSGNGFKLRTVNGASTVTSPDTLTWKGGRARLIVIIDTTTITLLDRDAGSSISLARPAWADAGVRVCEGCNRTVGGVVSNLCRTYVYVMSAHPSALSDIARRRNMDALQTYAPVSDGKGEYPDNAILIPDLKNGALRNLAAPALAIAWVNEGNSWSALTGGGIEVTGSSSNGLFAELGIPSSQTAAYLAVYKDFQLNSDYNAPSAWGDSVQAQGAAPITKHASGAKVFPMQRKSDGQYTYSTIGPKQGGEPLTVLSQISDSGKKHYAKEYDTSESVTVQGNVTWTGNLKVSLGGAKRPTGGYYQSTKAKVLGFVAVRGSFDADAIITTRALLEG